MILFMGKHKRRWTLWWNVPGECLLDMRADRWSYTLPVWLGVAHRHNDLDAFVCAPWGIHILVRWWYWRKSIFFGALVRARVWWLQPGDLWTAGEPVWPWDARWKNSPWVKPLTLKEASFPDVTTEEGARQAFLDEPVAPFDEERRP